MEKKVKRSGIAKIPAWVLSLFALIALIILLVFLEDPKSSSLSINQIIGYSFCVILITGACFLISMIHPKSIWYTIIICNIVSIQAIIVYIFTNLSPLWELIFWGGILILSSIGAIVGASIGKRRIDQVK